MPVDAPNSESEPRDERPKRSGCLVGCLIFLPLAYLLSPVPLLLIYVGFEELGWETFANGFANTLEVFLIPINWLYDNNEFARDFYDWYIGLIDGFAF